MNKPILLAVLQIGIVLSLAGKYMADRASRPRAWVKTAPVDPNLPIRGRYVSLRAMVPLRGAPPESGRSRHGGESVRVKLKREGKQLVAEIQPEPKDGAGASYRESSGFHANARINSSELDKPEGERMVTMTEAVAFFIPEKIPDPSLRQAGEELWMEVTLLANGKLRPIKLAVKKGDSFTELKPGRGR